MNVCFLVYPFHFYLFTITSRIRKLSNYSRFSKTFLKQVDFVKKKTYVFFPITVYILTDLSLHFWCETTNGKICNSYLNASKVSRRFCVYGEGFLKRLKKQL